MQINILSFIWPATVIIQINCIKKALDSLLLSMFFKVGPLKWLKLPMTYPTHVKKFKEEFKFTWCPDMLQRDTHLDLVGKLSRKFHKQVFDISRGQLNHTILILYDKKQLTSSLSSHFSWFLSSSFLKWYIGSKTIR